MVKLQATNVLQVLLQLLACNAALMQCMTRHNTCLTSHRKRWHSNLLAAAAEAPAAMLWAP
jgi:hypothetical protein